MSEYLACFTGDMPILTPDGHKRIDELEVGDLVLARSETDPEGPVEAKEVGQVFWRSGRIIHLHVRDQVIRTTPEHPFQVKGLGWVPADHLKIGDLLLSHDGQLIPVDDILDTGEQEAVFNVSVVDFCTYFVGANCWGWSVWAHNARKKITGPKKAARAKKPKKVIKAPKRNLNSNKARSRFGVYEIKVKGELHKVGKADLNRITKSSGLPTRLHQQVRKLEQKHGKDNVTHRIKKLGNTTTQLAKEAETARLQRFFNQTGLVPEGNSKSFFPS